MNISRILTFAIVLLLLRVVVSIVVAGFPAREEADSQLILQYVMGYALDAIVVIAVFAWLARVQGYSPYLHAFLVVALQELFGVALIFATGQDNPHSPLWIIDWAVLVASVLMGTEFGRRLRLAAERTAQE